MQAVVFLNLFYSMVLFDRRWFQLKNNDTIERFNETGNLIISNMILSMLTITDGVDLYTFGLLINYTLFFLLAANIIYVAYTIISGLCVSG